MDCPALLQRSRTRLFSMNCLVFPKMHHRTILKKLGELCKSPVESFLYLTRRIHLLGGKPRSDYTPTKIKTIQKQKADSRQSRKRMRCCPILKNADIMILTEKRASK